MCSIDKSKLSTSKTTTVIYFLIDPRIRTEQDFFYFCKQTEQNCNILSRYIKYVYVRRKVVIWDCITNKMHMGNERNFYLPAHARRSGLCRDLWQVTIFFKQKCICAHQWIFLLTTIKYITKRENSRWFFVSIFYDLFSLIYEKKI